ncbi:acetyltransferase [Microscilla marina]|uniref:Transferase hexapeptide repeat n=1 Tax=Microscilla marina ATCC 23134 TaxID=313606 RepID=A1ZZB2_MICM2|nr:acetyltransferase [Microscilla marina]EAY24264.1 transferase hexapeptide repeat [Microscilla marina ATCC 23134]
MKKQKKLIIVGNTTNARLAHWYFSHDSSYEVVAFSVHEAYIQTNVWQGLPVVPYEQLEQLYPPDHFDAFVAIGYKKMNQIREQMYTQTKAKGYFLPNYISSRCTFLTEAPIGDNNLILEDNTVQPFVHIGNNNVLWSGNHIGHDTVLHHHITLTSQVVVSGYCTIHNNCFLGVNATIHNEVTLAKATLVGAGAIIRKNTRKKEVYLPAKTILWHKKSDELDF